MKKIGTAVLGATGIVGQQFLRMLAGHPIFELCHLGASAASAGKSLRDIPWSLPTPPPERFLEMKLGMSDAAACQTAGAAVVFSALPSEVAAELEPKLAEGGCRIFSNASAHRLNPSIPLVIPEVNPEHLSLYSQRSKQGMIITNANCVTSGLALALKPLEPFGLRSIILSTYQAISGAGRRGLSALDSLNNIIPHIASEEEKIERETEKIFGVLQKDGIVPTSLDVNASCCRVPVRNGHLMNLVVELKIDASIETVSHTLAKFRGLPQTLGLPTAPREPILVRKERDRPQAALDRTAGRPDRAAGMAVTAGGLRKKKRRFNFSLLVHNTIRGAAGTCILNAELAYAQKLI